MTAYQRLLLLALTLGMTGCEALPQPPYHGMPQQVRLYRSPDYVPPGHNEEGFDRRLMNCSGGDRLRGWC